MDSRENVDGYLDDMLTAKKSWDGGVGVSRWFQKVTEAEEGAIFVRGWIYKRILMRRFSGWILLGKVQEGRKRDKSTSRVG